MDKLQKNEGDCEDRFNFARYMLDNERLNYQTKLDEIGKKRHREFTEAQNRTTELQLQHMSDLKDLGACNNEKEYLIRDAAAERKARDKCEASLAQCHKEVMTCNIDYKSKESENERLERAKELVMETSEGHKKELQQCNNDLKSCGNQKMELANEKLRLTIEIEKLELKQKECQTRLEDIQTKYAKCEEDLKAAKSSTPYVSVTY